jgi:chromate transporter
VVGVIANLAVFFALHTLFGTTDRSSWGWLSVEWPVLDTLRWVPLVIGVVAALLIFRYRWSVLRTLGLCALIGLVAGLAGLPVS